VTEVIEPATAVDVAAALRHASDERQSIVIRGAGTKSDWGRPAGHIDVFLDMKRLNRVLAHQHGDLTAIIEAGATLHDVNHALARHGQWLPLDPPFAEHATIGGILATNDSGPLRHRYGTPRDLVIGIQLATTDGLLSKAGGQVVKNVAGYDLSKLVAGSFGSLAAIVSATFKLTPLPAASKTLTFDVPDTAALAQLVRSVMASQLEPIAFEIDFRGGVGPPFQGGRGGPERPALHVLLRFASLPAVVEAQIARASAALKGCATSSHVVDGDAERALWREHASRLWDATGAIVRASWLPADVAAALPELERIAEPAVATEREPFDRPLIPSPSKDERIAQDRPVDPPLILSPSKDERVGQETPFDRPLIPSPSKDERVAQDRPVRRAAAARLKASPSIDLIGRGGVGAGHIRIDADEPAQAQIISQLRETAAFGNVVIVRGSAALKALVDVWGPQGDRQSLLGSLKRAFDPNGVLNAGRGPL
jgi:glycolate oxidase FAD binding subunit